MKVVSRNHQDELVKWTPDARIIERVKNTGFDVVYLMGFSMRSDVNLFVALVSLYSLEEEWFSIGGRKIAPTLDDVARIMGLPIDGKPVTGRDLKKSHFRALCEELLGSANFASGRSESQIKMKDLLDLMVVPQDAVGEGLDIYARAFVLYVLGCVVCPAKDNSKMPSMFLGLLRNVDEIKDFAWGAAFLAQSMHQVRCLRENMESTTTSACIPFFMVFLFEYVNDIASACIRGRVVVVPPLNFPLIVSWSDLLVIETQNNHGKLSKDQYLHMLGLKELILRPYERLTADFLPVHLRSQLHVAYTHTVMICFEQLAYHVPHVCPEKLGLQEEDIVELSPLPSAKSMQHTDANKPDWSVKFAEQVEA